MPYDPNMSGGNDPVRAAAMQMLSSQQQAPPAPAGQGPSPAMGGAPMQGPGGGGLGAILARTTAQIVDYVNQNGFTPEDGQALVSFVISLQKMADPMNSMGSDSQGPSGGEASYGGMPAASAPGAPMPGAPR